MPNPIIDEEYIRKAFKTFTITYWVGLGLSIVLIGIPILIIGFVYHFILLYRYWELFQSEKTSITPGRAVGFCFIPVFNLYWMFEAYYSLSGVMNRWVDERKLDSRLGVTPALALSYPILGVISVIPYVNLITIIPLIIIGYLLMIEFNRVALLKIQQDRAASSAA